MSKIEIPAPTNRSMVFSEESIASLTATTDRYTRLSAITLAANYRTMPRYQLFRRFADQPWVRVERGMRKTMNPER